MSKTIKLNKNEFISLISESVNRIIEEYDDYNEFDRNGGVNDISPDYNEFEKIRLKLLKEPYSKENERLLMNYLKNAKNKGEDGGDFYDELGNKYPRYKKAVENERSWMYDYDRADLPNKDDKLPTYGDDPYRQNKPFLSNARDWSATRGYYPEDDGFRNIGSYGDEFTAYDKKGNDDRIKNPKNDINLNVYNNNPGKYGMYALSDDPFVRTMGRSARNTLRDTYNAAKSRRSNHQNN